jgi:uncharacterized protein YndB with AHSA1/START domain
MTDELHRRVTTTGADGERLHEVSLVRRYDAEVEDVWDACTTPERIARWFLPVSGDLRLGGRYALEGNAGGTIERCDPPHGFTITWEFGGGSSTVELRLSADPAGGTRFELLHTVADDDHWRRFGPGAVGIGWEWGLGSLAQHLAGVPSTQPGPETVPPASRAWAAAHIAAGEDEAQATGAAERTAAFYTGA